MTANEEREYVRELARWIARIAASPENELVKKRWRDVNALRKPDRAPVYCRPIGALYELIPQDSLQCADPWLRSVEFGFKHILLKHDIGDDDPVGSEYAVGAAFDCDPPNVWGVDIAHHQPDVAGGAWSYDPPLKSESDFDKLRIPSYTYNPERTEASLSRANDLLGDILPVKIACGIPGDVSLSATAGELRGLGEMMMDMAVQPELVHRLMAFLRDSLMQTLDQFESSGMLTPNNTGSLFTSDPIGETGLDGKLTCANLWGGASGQEFDQVSPAMWEEFLLAYQLPLLERFGLTCYGCCENLTHKIDGALRIPNLRIFVCSAWTDLDRVIEKVGARYTIMWRQKASEVVFPEDTDGIRRHLNDGMRRLKGCCYQVVLRELQTLAGHMDRLHVWTQLAIAAAEEYA